MERDCIGQRITNFARIARRICPVIREQTAGTKSIRQGNEEDLFPLNGNRSVSDNTLRLASIKGIFIEVFGLLHTFMVERGTRGRKRSL